MPPDPRELPEALQPEDPLTRAIPPAAVVLGCIVAAAVVAVGAWGKAEGWW